MNNTTDKPYMFFFFFILLLFLLIDVSLFSFFGRPTVYFVLGMYIMQLLQKPQSIKIMSIAVALCVQSFLYCGATQLALSALVICTGILIYVRNFLYLNQGARMGINGLLLLAVSLGTDFMLNGGQNQAYYCTFGYTMINISATLIIIEIFFLRFKKHDSRDNRSVSSS